LFYDAQGMASEDTRLSHRKRLSPGTAEVPGYGFDALDGALSWCLDPGGLDLPLGRWDSALTDLGDDTKSFKQRAVDIFISKHARASEVLKNEILNLCKDIFRRYHFNLILIYR
jgi:hypothetical protein